MNDGLRIAREMAKVTRAQREHARQVKQRRAEIIQNDELTDEQQRGALDRLQVEGIAKHHKFTAEIEKLQKRADVWAKHVHVTRPVDDAKQIQVREMLRKGVTASSILEHAVEIGDSEAVAALRAEMLWFGSRDGFAVTTDTIRACDRVLAQIGRGEEADVNRGLVQMVEANEPVAAVSEYSGKVAIGQDSPHDTLAVAYATGAGAGEDDE